MASMQVELIKQLNRDEGRVKYAYQDHLGYWTIGVGRLIDKRKGGCLSDDEIDYLLSNDINKFQHEVLNKLPWVRKLDPARLGVLIAMAFQMGVDGLLGFKNTLKTIESGDYNLASQQMLKSKWAEQTPARAKRLATQMKTGVWQ